MIPDLSTCCQAFSQEISELLPDGKPAHRNIIVGPEGSWQSFVFLNISIHTELAQKKSGHVPNQSAQAPN